jgi:hypothetical protein
MGGVLFVKMGGVIMGSVWFAWEMGWELGLYWHMIKQMGNGKDEI